LTWTEFVTNAVKCPKKTNAVKCPKKTNAVSLKKKTNAVKCFFNWKIVCAIFLFYQKKYNWVVQYYVTHVLGCDCCVSFSVFPFSSKNTKGDIKMIECEKHHIKQIRWNRHSDFVICFVPQK